MKYQVVSPGGSLDARAQAREGARALVCTRSFSEYFFILESKLRTGHEGVREVLTSFLFPTTSQCKKFE